VVSDTAVASYDSGINEEPNFAKLLSDLEDQLRDAIGALEPAMTQMQENLVEAIVQLRQEKDASLLWTTFSDLQSLLSLVQQICVTCGSTPDPVIAFDSVLGDALETIEQGLPVADSDESIAKLIEVELVPALGGWDGVSESLRLVAGITNTE